MCCQIRTLIQIRNSFLALMLGAGLILFPFQQTNASPSAAVDKALIIFNPHTPNPLKIKPVNPQPSWDDMLTHLKAVQAQEAIDAARAAQDAYNARIKAQRSLSYPDTYSPGNCTWEVASLRGVPPGWGNANNWLAAAQAAGWITGSSPMVGAIAQTTNGWAGHVALVQSINNDNTVTVLEMNVMGYGIVDTQNYPTNYFNYVY